MILRGGLVADVAKLIKKSLKIYPIPLRRLLENSVFISYEERFLRNERVDGSYDVETGEIILWNPQNAEEEDLFIVLTHEWGHKIYHEWLSDKERTDWLKIRSEERIDFELNKFYPAVKLPEEEYCAVFCIISKKLFLEKMGMKRQEKKIAQRIKKEFPKAAALVEGHIGKGARKRVSLSSPRRHDITHREVEAIKAWIRETIQH
jgi:hypothetical protein